MNSSCPECGKILRNPKRCSCGWILKESKQDQDASNKDCGAYGCPMHGGINASVSGGGMWLCPMHFRAHPSNWQLLTERLRQRMTHVNLIREIRMSQNGRPFDHTYWMETIKDTELYPNNQDRRPIGSKGLSMRKWQVRIEKALFAQVMPGMDEEEVHKGQSKSSEEIMKHIEAFVKQHSIGA